MDEPTAREAIAALVLSPTGLFLLVVAALAIVAIAVHDKRNPHN